jgi:hypothetical protein
MPPNPQSDKPRVAVEIRIDGTTILCLEANSMSGVRDLHKYEPEIQTAISWLNAFVSQNQR